ADGGADLLDAPLAVVAEVPRRRAAGDVKEEVAQDLRSRLGVRDLGMEEDAETAPLEVVEGADRRVVRSRRDAESRRRGDDAVAVAGPHRLRPRRVGEERRLFEDIDLRAAVSWLAGRLDLAVQQVRGELHPIA